jgi:hypothetical protein
MCAAGTAGAPGAEFEVEDQGDAVILRPARVDPQTTIEQVFGRLRRDAPPLTIEQMNAAVAREARWRR